ncbi:MAG: aminomethyl-transferring glycine dehydrogenase [Ignavibacteriales bacterium CG07_land_8_20_14_0_80_59_12]|nr:MAG: aminomethyl-transferring glycine dehydrogenase [Ignavibacteriales bacterium CG07_land_8_20_14_0_80_59_12]
MPFVPNTSDDEKEMLAAIGVSDFDELLRAFPESVRLKTPLNLPGPLSEFEVLSELQEMSSANSSADRCVTFQGAGAYDHFIPSVVPTVIGRSEFATAYTPFQPEVSQGTLQAMYEYQSMICALTGMDVANASMYDCGSALGEACLLAAAHTGRREILLAGKVNPLYVEIIRTYGDGQGLQVHAVPPEDGGAGTAAVQGALSANTAAVVLQQPNFFGIIEEVGAIAAAAHAAGTLVIMAVDPISLAILKTPAEQGADVVVAEGQSLGIPLSMGGPYLGVFAAKKELIRRMPGRMSGMTNDVDGRRGFVMALQTREQHIRREKATSNICTNEGLMMLAATVYLSLMGPIGLKEVASLSLQKSHYLARQLSALPGFRVKHSRPFFKEFLLETKIPASQIIDQCSERGILPGVDVSSLDPAEEGLLIAVTEKRTRSELDRFVDALRAL